MREPHSPLTPAAVTLSLEAESIEQAVTTLMARPGWREPGQLAAVAGRLRGDASEPVPSYLGHGVVVVTRITSGTREAELLFGRSESGVPRSGHDDRMHLIFVLLLPNGSVGTQQMFTAAIAASIESEYVRGRLMSASEPGEIVEAIGDGLSLAQR